MEVKPSFLQLLQFFLIKFILLINFTNCDEIYGCGGFIKSHADIDFSKVEIKLLTKQGSLKDKTDCSPSNGYYFLPVYDKGEYILKISPPPGWSFEPESVELNFNGKTDICSQGKDVNFIFKGFGITGKVALAGHSTGAKDVNVELRSEDGSDIRKTVTDINGVYSFTPIIPGKYIIKASHNKWYFSKPEHTVIVESGNTELPENSLIVSGFDVQGKISSNGQAFINIGIVLFQEKSQKLSSFCSKENLPQELPGNSNYDSKPICFSLADKNGDYIFKGIPPGKYLIKPVVSNKELKLHIQPKIIEFQVGKDSLLLKDQFEITGFSVSGRVLNSQNGRGVSKATVKLNGEVVATTHTDGSYVLDNAKPGTYTLEVSAENLQFNEQTVKISLLNPIIPNVVVSAFKVCGIVVSERSHVIGITKYGSTFHTTTVSNPGSGEWCSHLPSGKYSIEVVTSDVDKSNGIQFFPITQTIEVTTTPLSGIIFSQLRATINGEIKCLPDSTNTCRNIEVTLHFLDSNGKSTGQTIFTQAENGKYSFSKVLPGQYQLTISQSNLCWETTSHNLNVKTASENVAPFVHKGYEISLISSHKAKMQYTLQTPQKSPTTVTTKSIDLLSGVNTFCVSQFGDYTINLEGCHKYDSNLPKSFTTYDTNPLILTAVSHKTGIRILSTEIDSFQILVVRKSGKETISLTPETSKIDGYHSYRYDTYLMPEEPISITPQSNIMLFKPETKEIFGGNDCIDVAFNFIATRGLIIEGKFQPPIKDVKVTLSFPDNPELKPLQTVSSATGNFKFGPIDESIRVELKAEKESYIFSDYDKTTNIFKAHKLCDVIVSVKDEGGNKLSGVLLSLSGAESYRKNMITGDDGTIKFHSLSPSQYYLRPMMKEYKFNPNSKMIEVKDGETVKVELSGKRVAYSVFGLITSLNGDPFPQVVVEAISTEECMHHQEESTSENNGQYRIRGLQPGCKYTIRIKSGDVNINVERSIPISQNIEIINDDVKNINLIGISPIGFVDVIARVYASQNDYYKTLRIQMYKKGNADSPIYSQRVDSPINPKRSYNPGIMVFFPRIPLDSKTYFVELKTSISDKMYKYTLPSSQFLANTSSIYVELNFNPEIKTGEGDLNQNSISALILVGLVAIAFFKQDIAIDLLNFIWNRINIIVEDLMNRQTKKKESKYSETINYREIEQLAEGINAIKKKKPKKI